MSIPITCKSTQLDFLGSVLYGAHDSNLDNIITESGKRCAVLYNSGYAWSIAEFATSENAPRNLKIAAFFFLLNKDPDLRESLTTICPYKASRLYKKLENSVIPQFVKNESSDLNDFISALKEMYRNE